jgi:hypothetical protein
MCTIPWRLSKGSKYSMPKSLVFSARAAIWMALSGSGLGRTVGGGHVVIDHGQGALGVTHLAVVHAQAFEGLRARHFMHEMPVDIEQRGAILVVLHQMVVPDLVVERAGLGHCGIPAGEFGVVLSREGLWVKQNRTHGYG